MTQTIFEIRPKKCFVHWECISLKNPKNSIITYLNHPLFYSAYQIVVEEVNPQRTRRQASSDCYEVTINPFLIHALQPM